MDLESLLFHPDNTGINPGAGKLLVASPLINEPFFKRGVVLVLDSDSKGGLMGLVLNKSSRLSLGDLMPGWKGGFRVPVYCGGPVETDRMFMLHTMPDIITDSTEILPGIFVGGNLKDMVEYINGGGESEGNFRFFLGYSGWLKGQLDSELEENVWALKKIADPHLLFSGTGNPFWRREVKDMGERYRGWLTVPEDPDLN